MLQKFFRNCEDQKHFEHLSNNGNEICFCTIGDASTSEGHFWETMNAAGVMQVPLAVFVWDDGYGISVPKKYQTTKGSISTALTGFQKTDQTNGINIYKVNGWDYAGMCEVFEAALEEMRETHVPALFHVEEITQPQGHSTSGSHERYKSQERLQWEREWDALRKMKEWIVANGLASEEELSEIEVQAKTLIRESRTSAWDKYLKPIKQQVAAAADMIERANDLDSKTASKLKSITTELRKNREPNRKDVLKALRNAITIANASQQVGQIKKFYTDLKQENKQLYNSLLYNEGPKSALNVAEEKPVFAANAPTMNGYEVLNRYFDQLINHDPRVFAFGEDVGQIGDVNQGFAGLQYKYGSNRVFDTGIRELTIVGQGHRNGVKRPTTHCRNSIHRLPAIWLTTVK